MRTQAFQHLRADGQHRIQRHHWILEDHGDVVAADLAHLLFVQAGELAPLEFDGSGMDVPGLGNKIQNRKTGYGFACSGFAHQAHAFALVQAERDVVHGGEFAAPESEFDAKVGNLEKSAHNLFNACRVWD